MISCKILLCAQGVVRDADDGTISIFGLIEGVEAVGFPFFFQQMAIFALLERLHDDPAQYELLFRISIGDTELAAAHLAIDFLTGLRNRSTVRIQGLVVPGPGVLRASVHLADRLLGTYEMTIGRMEPPRVEARQLPEPMIPPREPPDRPTPGLGQAAATQTRD